MNEMIFSIIANSALDKDLTVQVYVFDCVPSSHRL